MPNPSTSGTTAESVTNIRSRRPKRVVAASTQPVRKCVTGLKVEAPSGSTQDHVPTTSDRFLILRQFLHAAKQVRRLRKNRIFQNRLVRDEHIFSSNPAYRGVQPIE
jgi:hypothetical protein